jgi:hypothetical protein
MSHLKWFLQLLWLFYVLWYRRLSYGWSEAAWINLKKHTL